MKTSFTFCLLFAFCLGAAIETKAQVNVNDSLALVDLYNSTNGSNWTTRKGWLKSPVANWYGIRLALGGERVASIGLGSNNLRGYIPSSLSNLSNLEGLNLSANFLTGNIPPELGNLSNLSYLNLENNQFSGSIPSELGNLTRLTYLDLYHNQLSGSIPPQLGNLLALISLDLDYNQLSGPIPPKLGNL